MDICLKESTVKVYSLPWRKLNGYNKKMDSYTLENQDRTWKAFEKESGILFQGAILRLQVSFR